MLEAHLPSKPRRWLQCTAHLDLVLELGYRVKKRLHRQNHNVRTVDKK